MENLQEFLSLTKQFETEGSAAIWGHCWNTWLISDVDTYVRRLMR